MTQKEKKNKIYSYFYGFSYILQYYIIFAGATMAAMSIVAFGDNRYFGGVVFLMTGLLMIIGALGWMVYKHFTNNTSGEKAVDEEMQKQIELTKAAALDKLNIISEQIESVPPVVLSGVAAVDMNVATVLKQLKKRRILNLFLWLIKIYLFEIVVTITLAIPFGLLINGVFFGGWILFMVFVGAVSGFFYVYVEKKSYVNPKKILELDKNPPRMIRKYGSDDVVRVSLPSITVYMFSEEQLFVYTRYFNIITGKVFYETVNEYFYEDIVAVTSKQETVTALRPSRFKKFILENADYLEESISVITTSGCAQKETYVVNVGESLLDTEFMGMRNLIRQKKMRSVN